MFSSKSHEFRSEEYVKRTHQEWLHSIYWMKLVNSNKELIFVRNESHNNSKLLPIDNYSLRNGVMSSNSNEWPFINFHIEWLIWSRYLILFNIFGLLNGCQVVDNLWRLVKYYLLSSICLVSKKCAHLPEEWQAEKNLILVGLLMKDSTIAQPGVSLLLSNEKDIIPKWTKCK